MLFVVTDNDFASYTDDYTRYEDVIRKLENDSVKLFK